MKNYSKNIFSKAMLSSCVALLLTSIATAQTAAIQSAPAPETFQDKLGVWGNPVFDFLVIFALILVILIRTLSKTLISVAENELKKNQAAKIIAILLTAGLFASNSTLAQPAATPAAAAATTYYGLSGMNFWGMLILISIELVVVFALLRRIQGFINPPLPTTDQVYKPNAIERFMASLSALKPMEEEQTLIMHDHSYDGIQELDNGMPPWLKYMFVATVVSAFLYLLNYHVLRTGMLQAAEYNKEMSDADIAMKEYRVKAGENIDESNVKLLTDADGLAKGKEIYLANCVACHAPDGGGLVGPNFTDDYWIHGGSINDLFKTIKIGVVEKGMKSWQAELSPSQMQAVASYIKTFRGTTAANPKAPQGDLYKEAGAASDSTGAKTDSTTTAIKTDTAAVATK